MCARCAEIMRRDEIRWFDGIKQDYRKIIDIINVAEEKQLLMVKWQRLNYAQIFGNEIIPLPPNNFSDIISISNIFGALPFFSRNESPNSGVCMQRCESTG
jgi:hypothetical protein